LLLKNSNRPLWQNWLKKGCVKFKINASLCKPFDVSFLFVIDLVLSAMERLKHVCINRTSLIFIKTEWHARDSFHYVTQFHSITSDSFNLFMLFHHNYKSELMFNKKHIKTYNTDDLICNLFLHPP
jgi:hypothetical protein